MSSSEDQQDPSNWKWGMFYYNPTDPRVWLPKRNPMMGWTVNFAHRAAIWWLIGLMAIPMAVSLIVFFAESLSK